MLRFLALIPARGGSKGLPGKNLRVVAGKPLISWTISAALGCDMIREVVVSTDCKEIADVALSCGALVPFMRPAALASDTATSFEVVEHALSALGRDRFDAIVLLQPTSPLRTSRDISQAIAMFKNSNVQSLASVCETKKHPNWMRTLSADGLLTCYEDKRVVTRRQGLPPVYVLNGAIYISSVAALVRTRLLVSDPVLGYVMPESKSFDVDSETDLKICEMLLSGDELLND